MANTVISIDTSFDVIEKQRELVTEALGADGVYIRFKETLKEYFDEGALKNPDIAAVVGQTISQMATSITNSAMNTALDWAARERALILQKEELEYKIDLMKLEAEKLAFEKDAAVGKKFTKYNDFKKYTFAHAVDEINSQYEMNLRFEELKEGRRVVSIRFEFTKSYTVPQGYNPATKQMVNITVKPKRKTNQDDDNAPPPVHPDQQELPLNQESTGQKILKTAAKGLSKLGIKPVPEVKKALDERKDTSAKETLKAIAKGAINADKRRISEVAKTAKILMDTMGISALEAYEIAEKKVKPI